MNIIRQAVSGWSNRTLEIAFADGDEWERTGTLREGSPIRLLANDLFPDAFSPALQMTMVQHEVWRSIAVRRHSERDQARSEAVAERTARRMETTGRSEKNFALDHPFSWEVES